MEQEDPHENTQAILRLSGRLAALRIGMIESNGEVRALGDPRGGILNHERGGR